MSEMVSADNTQIRHSFAPEDISEIAQLWVKLGWGQDDVEGRERIGRVLVASTWIAVAESNGRFAGYARALSDGVLVTYLVEVAVVPEYRRRGVGGALIQSCLDAFRHTAIYADAVPEIVGLNTRYGLRPRPSHLTACARGPQEG